MLPPAAPQPARPHRLSRWAVQAAIAPPQAARHGQALPSGPRFTHDRRAGAEGLPKRSFVLAVLAAIVVGVATLALGLALAVRIREAYGSIEEDEIVAADAEHGERE